MATSLSKLRPQLSAAAETMNGIFRRMNKLAQGLVSGAGSVCVPNSKLGALGIRLSELDLEFDLKPDSDSDSDSGASAGTGAATGPHPLYVAPLPKSTLQAWVEERGVWRLKGSERIYCRGRNMIASYQNDWWIADRLANDMDDFLTATGVDKFEGGILYKYSAWSIDSFGFFVHREEWPWFDAKPILCPLSPERPHCHGILSQGTKLADDSLTLMELHMLRKLTSIRIEHGMFDKFSVIPVCFLSSLLSPLSSFCPPF